MNGSDWHWREGDKKKKIVQLKISSLKRQWNHGFTDNVKTSFSPKINAETRRCAVIGHILPHSKAVVTSAAPNPTEKFKRFTFSRANLGFESTVS